MLPNATKEQYRENKRRYFSYHSQITNAFQKDCEKLLLAFERQMDLSFKAFSEVWKKLSFDLVFSGQEWKDEQAVFIEACFFTIKKYIVFSQNAAIQIGALYMLYAFYYKEAVKVNVKIRCVHNDFDQLTKLVAKMQQREINDVPFIFTKLKMDNAFQFVALPRVCALEGKFMWQERKMLNNTFETVKKGNPIYDTKSVLFSTDFYGLNSFYNISDNYAKGLEKYGFPKTDCERIKDLPEEIQNLCKQMEQKQTEVSTVIETSSRLLKKRAFTSKVKPIPKTIKNPT